MRILFMGTPEFAIPTLDRLHGDGHRIVAAYTQPPRPAGRGKAPRPSPVQLRAEALGIEVRCPQSLRDPAEHAAFAGLEPDLVVVAAYGLILPQAILEVPVWDCLNVHASLLPRWRGAAPIQRAILAGDGETGVTIMSMEAGLDCGATLCRASIPIERQNAGELTGALASIGADLLAAVIADPGQFPSEPQPESGVTYAPKIDKAETRLDFSPPAVQVERQIRAFAPLPGAWFEHQGERVRILAADIVDAGGVAGLTIGPDLTIACGSGAIRATRVQRAGRDPMTAAELLRGWPIAAGARLAA